MKTSQPNSLEYLKANAMRCAKHIVLIIPQYYRQLLLGLSLLFVMVNSRAEGVRQVAPTLSDSPVMLETGRPEFGNFAKFNGPESSRLYISINDPNEIIYIGLSPEYNDDGLPFSGSFSGQYRFRIKRVNDMGPDPVVHGPFDVTNENANVNSYTQALFGGYNVTTMQNDELMYQFAPGQSGDYYIEFEDAAFPDGDTKVNIALWDFTVALNGNPIDGRVWSRNWAFRTPATGENALPDCLWNREFNGSLYSYTTDGFVSRIDFQDAGLQGLSFNVAFNSSGPGTSGNLVLDRQSIPNENATLNSAEHQIFLSEPDIMLFPSGLCGELFPQSTFSCLGADSFCIEVEVTKPGQVEVIVDFNQNGVLDPDSQDLSLVYDFPPGELTGCIPWDGIRGDGTEIAPNDTVDLIFIYSQGIQHWSAYDVEILNQGYCIETIRPTCQPEITSNLLFWDDRNIPVDPGTGAVKDGRNGCPCETSCRNWNNFNVNTDNCGSVVDGQTDGYGDKATINTWWFASTRIIVQANIPLVTAQVIGLDTICEGETTVFTALDEGATEPITYSWSGPNNFTADTEMVEIGVAGEYCVTITDDIGCESSNCRTLTVFEVDPDIISYPANIAACIGDVVTLSPTGDTDGFTFSWLPTTGLDDPTSPSPTFTFTGQAAYTVTITSLSTDCSFSQTVDVNALTETQAAFSTQTGCDQGLEVVFVDESVNADQYNWTFGDPTTTDDTSDEANPSYTYSAPGTYLVTLITTSADGCTAMATQEVVVEDVALEADFEISFDSCSPDSVVVQFTNTSINEANNTISYSWVLSTGQTSDLENPTFTYFADQTFTAILTINTADGCTSSDSQEVTVQLGPPLDQFPASLIVCPGDSVQLVPGGDPDLVYNWEPTTGIDDPSSPSPTFFPATTTDYTVTVQSISADTCTVIETINVFVPPVIDLAVSGDGIICTDSTTLVATTSSPTTVAWLDEGGNVLATGDEYTVFVSGSTDYTAVATDASGCTETVTVNVSGGPLDFTVPDTLAVCLGEEEIVLSVNNLDPNDTLSYLWTPSQLFVPGTNTLPVPNYLETVGEELVSVQLANQYGCLDSADIVVAVIDPDIDLSFTSELDCNGGTVFFTNTSTNAFGYVWDFGDGSAPNYEVNPQHTYAMAGTYTVTLSIVFDVDCMMDFSAEVTTQDPQVIADFTYDIAECSADSAVIQFTDISTNTFNNTIGWEWTFDDAVPATSGEQNPEVTVFGNGPLEVTLTILTANNCSNTTTEVLDIQLVDIDVAPMDTLIVCPGDGVTLNEGGNPDYVYDWMPAEGLDDPTAPSPFASPDVTTTYVLTAYTIAGSDTCFVTDSVVVFIPEAINLDIGDDIVFSCGEDVTITATTDVDVDIEWTSTTEGPLGSGSMVTVNPFREDTIIAVATDEFGCIASDTVIVIDNGVDVNAEPGTEITACEGVDTTLTIVNLDDLDILTYSWSPEEFIIGPTDGPSVTIQVDDPGTVIFTAILTNQLGCADTVDFTVNVLAFAGDLPDTVFACYNQPTPLHPAGDPTYEYEWDPPTGLDLTDPWNPIATLTEDQSYSVTVTDLLTGCTTVDTVEVIVYPEINLQTEGDTVLCEIETLELTATANIAVDIEWFDDDNSLVGSGPSVSVTPEVGVNTYTAIATDPNTNCMDTSMVVVQIQPQLELMTEGDTAICRIVPIDISATTAIDVDLEWTYQGTVISTMNQLTVTPELIGENVYTVIATDPLTGCMDTSAVIIEVFPQINLETFGDTALCEITPVILTAETEIAVDLIWYFAGDEIDTGTPITVIPPGDGDFVYTAIATDPNTGCTDTSTVSIKVQLFTDELPIDPVTVCANEPTAINPGGDPNLIYEWSPDDEFIDLTDPSNPVITTDMPLTYMVTVTDPIFGCTVMDTINIGVYPEMNLSVGEDLILCGEETITLTATTDIEPSSIIWYQLPDNDEVGSGSTITYGPPLGTTLIYAEAISGDGCTERDTLQIDNYPINADLTGDLLFCEPTETADLTVTNNDPAQILTITWSPEESILTDPAEGPTVTVDPNIDPAFVDTYTAEIVNQYGCTETLTTTVTTVDLEGDLDIFADPDTITIGNSTVITVTGCVGCEYEWFPPSGDIDPEDGPIITATPTEVGDQLYEVDVSLLGCELTLSVNVFVFDAICDTDHLFLPNAFTPNQDGSNDELRLRSVFLDDILEYELLIYDRWGEEIFRSENPYESWDGTFRGEALAPDVYGYYLRILCPDEEELIQKGNINLLR